jgi:hypothetical protein
MPPEHATDKFVESTKGKTIFEIGPGSAERVIGPSLERGAATIYAVDVYEEHLELIRKTARRLDKEDVVKTQLIDRRWWNKPLLKRPTVAAILDVGVDEKENIPTDSSVDMMMVRHVAQFGSPHSFLCLLDLAQTALTIGGEIWGINMSPFLQYRYECGDGEPLYEIIKGNDQFLAGERDTPGGYTRLDTCLRKYLDERRYPLSPRPFLYFDDETFHGLYICWIRSRVQRGLPANLGIKYTTYFSPRTIWEANKLVGLDEHKEKENHVFVLTKLGWPKEDAPTKRFTSVRRGPPGAVDMC